MVSIPGIAIVTYNRPDYLRKCLDAIFEKTIDNSKILVVCDSDKDLETIKVCQDRGIDFIASTNRGVVWNKNRGLYYFMEKTDCDPIILLEDDTLPISANWTEAWADAARRWHHVNYSHPALSAPGRAPISGEGTPESPHIHTLVTGQCTAVSRFAIETAGYLDTRFKGYGHGHVEWSRRHASLLYNGLVEGFSSATMLFLSISGGLKAENAPTFRNEQEVARNHEILRRTMSVSPSRLEPWHSQAERELLQSEINSVNKVMHATSDSKDKRPVVKQSFRGCLDACFDKGGEVILRGWGVTETGSAISDYLVQVGNERISPNKIKRIARGDVHFKIPDTVLDSGFEICFNFAEHDKDSLIGEVISLLPLEAGSVGSRLVSPKVFRWPPEDGTPKVPDAPVMPEHSVARIVELMQRSKRYLEYGTGGTTLKALELGIPEIVCVESDVDWLEAVRREGMKYEGSSVQILIHGDIGETKEWGYPVSHNDWKKFPNYSLAPWKHYKKNGNSPDLVLIDGRFRVACCMATLLFAKPGCTVLFDDYMGRPSYHVVENFVARARTHDRLAEFIVPEDLPRDDVWMQFVAACADAD